MPNAPSGAAAESLPTRRHVLTGIAVSAFGIRHFDAAGRRLKIEGTSIAVPGIFVTAAAIDMPADIPAYFVERWPELSRTEREAVANGWRALGDEGRLVFEVWCRLPEDRKRRVFEQIQA